MVKCEGVRVKKEKNISYYFHIPYHFTSEVTGFLMPRMLVRNALALPNLRNMSRRMGMWLWSSVT